MDLDFWNLKSVRTIKTGTLPYNLPSPWAVSGDSAARIGKTDSYQFHPEQAHIIGKLSGYTTPLDLCDDLTEQLSDG